MNHIKRRVISSALGAMACAVAACGSANEEATSPLPLDEVATSSAEGPSPTSVPDQTTTLPPQIDSAIFESMLETENGRALLVNGIAEETGLETDAAECLLDGLPIETLVAAAESFLGNDAPDGFFPADQMSEVAPLLESCGVDPTSLLP